VLIAAQRSIRLLTVRRQHEEQRASVGSLAASPFRCLSEDHLSSILELVPKVHTWHRRGTDSAPQRTTSRIT